ncbi:CidA-associated membrane protein CidB [Salmonella enterica subsp. enterica]|nr:CidA-associated membrane protein CidB [Salmonella enterica subsp. enterica]
MPVYDNLAIIKRHWMSLTAGVVTATVVAVTSSVWLARLFTLSDEIQRSLAVRSVTTPFALAAAEPLGGQPDLGGACSWSSLACLAWRSATRYFCVSLSGKAWQKGRIRRGVTWGGHGAFL